jgi:hypothetical protein
MEVIAVSLWRQFVKSVVCSCLSIGSKLFGIR